MSFSLGGPQKTHIDQKDEEEIVADDNDMIT